MLTRDGISAVVTTTDNTSETADVSIQFYGASEEKLAEPVVIQWFLTTDAGAQTLATDATDISEIAIKTNGAILCEHTTDVIGMAVTEATGLIDFTVTVVTTKQAVLNIVLPNGKLAQSAVMSYTAG